MEVFLLLGNLYFEHQNYSHFDKTLNSKVIEMPGTDTTKQAFKIANPGDGPKLSAAQLAFMKLTEQQNIERVRKLDAIRRRNWMTGWTLGFCVLGIYGYTILTVKQERFLDDFNPPEKIVASKPE